MLRKAERIDPGNFVTILGLVQSIALYIACVMAVEPVKAMAILLLLSILSLIIALSPLAFSKKESFPLILSTAGSISIVHFYTGILPGFLMLIVAGFSDAKNAIITFALLTFGNDSLAWFFGILFGKRRNIIDVSPNKSIAGFIGGALGSIAGAFLGLGPLAGSWKPEGPKYVVLSLALGVGMAFFVIVGDLFESALKRSAGMKDSGEIVPGRGGVLDSFDSLYYSAPFFVFFSYIARLFFV